MSQEGGPDVADLRGFESVQSKVHVLMERLKSVKSKVNLSVELPKAVKDKVHWPTNRLQIAQSVLLV